MSFAESANKSAFPPFANKQVLAEHGTRFCVSEVKDAVIPSSGKPVWHLIIHYDNERTETLSFDKNPGAKRDNDIQELRGDLATQARVHGVYLSAEPTKRQSPFIALRCDTAWRCSCPQEAVPGINPVDDGYDDDIPLPPEPPVEEEYVPF